MKLKSIALLGTLLAPLCLGGQAEAMQKLFDRPKTAPASQAAAPAPGAQQAPAGYEGLKSTFIHPMTKDLVRILETSKDPKDAWDKLCREGDMLKRIQPGYFRGKEGEKKCTINPSSVVTAFNACFGYPGFEKSDCAKGAMKILFPTLSKTKSLAELMKMKIEIPIETKVVSGQEDNKFTSVAGPAGRGHDRTVSEELTYYALPEQHKENFGGFQVTNAKVLLCRYDKGIFSPRANLPGNLNAIAKSVCFGGPGQAASATSSVKAEPSLKPVEKVPMPGEAIIHEPGQRRIRTSPETGGTLQPSTTIPPIRPSLKELEDDRARLSGRTGEVVQAPTLEQLEADRKALMTQKRLSTKEADDIIKARQTCRMEDPNQKRQNLKKIMDITAYKQTLAQTSRTFKRESLDSSNQNELLAAANEACRALENMFTLSQPESTAVPARPRTPTPRAGQMN